MEIPTCNTNCRFIVISDGIIIETTDTSCDATDIDSVKSSLVCYAKPKSEQSEVVLNILDYGTRCVYNVIRGYRKSYGSQSVVHLLYTYRSTRGGGHVVSKLFDLFIPCERDVVSYSDAT